MYDGMFSMNGRRRKEREREGAHSIWETGMFVLLVLPFQFNLVDMDCC